MSSQRERRQCEDRVTILRERIASLKDENEGMRKAAKDLEEAKDHLRLLNNDLIQRLKMETDKRIPFNQAFETFKAYLEAEKQKELTLLALRRIVSSQSKYLQFQTKKALQSISSESMLTNSMASIKDDVSGQDSGLEINEMQGLKEENLELKLESANLHTDLQFMTKTIESQRAVIEEIEEDLKAARQKWKTFEDHSSLQALHAHKYSERKGLLENELQFITKRLEDVKANNAGVIKTMEEKHTRERKRFASQTKKTEEVSAACKKNNANLKEELQERDLHNQAKDIAGAAIIKSLQETINEDMINFLAEKKSMVDNLALLEAHILDQESKILEHVNMLKESDEKFKMYEEKESFLLSQLDEISLEKKSLKNEVALKENKLQIMEKMSIEQLRKVADENEAKNSKEVLKNKLLEEEIARCRKSQIELEDKLQEKELLLKSKLAEFDCIIASMADTYKAETTRYNEELKELQKKIKEGENKYNSLDDKANLLGTQLVDAQRELVGLKDLYHTKIEELIFERSDAHMKFLNEHAEKVRKSNSFKVKKKWFMEKCRSLEEVKTESEVKAGRLQVELNAREEKVRKLDEQLTTLYERLNAKDLVIEELSIKKSKRRGIRRLLCC